MRIEARAPWALAVLLGGALLVSAAGQASAHGWLERLQATLELNDDQVKAIQEIYTRDADSRRQLVRALRQARSDLRRLALEGADEAAIQHKAGEVEGLLAQGIQLRVRHLQEIGPLLTPEQRERFAQLAPRGPWMRRLPHHRPAPGTAS